jgi:iron-sulfur cluster assembly protein
MSIFALMETTVTTPVTLTEGAITAIKKLMAAEGFDATQSLRVGVKGGGCSGMSYVLGFDKKEADDNEFQIEGIPCLMKSAHDRLAGRAQQSWLYF